MSPTGAGHHHFGRMIFLVALDEERKEVDRNKKLICLDGQQRITSTLIFLSSLRDFAISQNKNASNENEEKQLSALIKTLNSFISFDLDLFEKDVLKYSGSIDLLQEGEDVQSIR